jgi:hypothetical protein
VQIVRHDGAATLPPDALALLAAGEAEDFQLGRAWFDLIAANAVPDGIRPMWLLAHDAGRVRALLPLLRPPGKCLTALASPYTCLFRPLVAADAGQAELAAIGRAFAGATRGAGPLRLDALDPACPAWPALLRGWRRGGVLALPFAHFGNWHASVAGLDWAGYLAGRPGELRTTIRRKLARAERDPSIRLELIAGGAGLAPAIAAYEAIYARSWKEPEPFPGFAAGLIAAAAGTGALRLALLWHGEAPVAAQIWTVSRSIATVHKLAHDEAEKAISPGTVLTAWTIRHLIEREGIAGLDFGRGDDPYKAGWTGQRRQRTGLLLCPPMHPAGAVSIVRHFAGQAARRWHARKSSPAA